MKTITSRVQQRSTFSMLSIVIYLAMILILVQAAQSQKLRHTEMIARPTDHSITVHCLFNEEAEIKVLFGTTSGAYTTQTAWQSALADSSTKILLENLLADAMYYYRVCYRKPGASDSTLRPEHTFHTARKAGSSFNFVIQADPHLDENSDSTLYRRCLQNQLDDQPDFMLDLGDFLMSDKLKNTAGQLTHDTVTSRSRLLRSFYEGICHSVPLYISLGNHEGESGWNLNGKTENVAVWGTNDRKKFFPNPAPNDFYTGDTIVHPFVGQRENYYAWHWGDALFIVLDPYWYTSPKPDSLHGWRWTLGKVQYDWLKRTLEANSSPFTFVFAHQIIGGDPNGRGGVEFANFYEWGGKNLDGTEGFAANRPGWYKPIKELLTEHRVTAFFHGHDHFFGQQKKDCLIYQECPQPSLPNFQSANQAKDYGYFEGTILPNAGHLRVNVSSEGVKVDYVRAYLSASENATRHNKDVSASYYIGKRNCYDSLSSSVPILWNSDYADELVYPNPTAGPAHIQFSIKEPQSLSVRVFSTEGRLVCTLANNMCCDAGNFTMLWDGTDDNSVAVPEGSYICELVTSKAGRQSMTVIVRH